MGLVFLGSTVGIALLASRRTGLPVWENLLGAAILAVAPTVAVWALLN